MRKFPPFKEENYHKGGRLLHAPFVKPGYEVVGANKHVGKDKLVSSRLGIRKGNVLLVGNYGSKIFTY